MSNEIVRRMLLAQAAWMELESAIKSFEAAVIRNDHEGIEAARQRAHTHLDSHMDLKAEAQQFVLKAGGQT